MLIKVMDSSAEEAHITVDINRIEEVKIRNNGIGEIHTMDRNAPFQVAIEEAKRVIEILQAKDRKNGERKNDAPLMG